MQKNSFDVKNKKKEIDASIKLDKKQNKNRDLNKDKKKESYIINQINNKDNIFLNNKIIITHEDNNFENTNISNIPITQILHL